MYVQYMSSKFSKMRFLSMSKRDKLFIQIDGSALIFCSRLSIVYNSYGYAPSYTILHYSVKTVN